MEQDKFELILFLESCNASTVLFKTAKSFLISISKVF